MMKYRIKTFLTTNEMIVVYIIIGLAVLIGLVNPAFNSLSTVVNLSRTMLVTLIFAMCEMMVIVSGGIDVSFPAIACLAMIATGNIMLKNQIDNIPVAFIMGALIGASLGALNAILIAIIKMPPLIATLGVSSMTSGATLAIFGAKIITNLPGKLDKLYKVSLYTYTNAEGITYSLTILILIPIFICLLGWLLLKFTMFGRGIYAVGGDIRAARIAGFNVKGILFFVYIFSGTMAGIAGVTYMILMRAADPSVLMGSEMMVIAAVVMGGTRITGGHGTVIGTILGVTLIALVKNNLIMLGVPAHYQTFVVGLIMIIGTSITSLKAKHIANSIKV
jgi:simple sugar transport system permease protein